MAKKTISGIDVGPAPPEQKPTKKEEPEKTKAIGIRLPADLVDDLDKLAKAHQVNRTALVRYALIQFVDDLQSGKVELPKRTVTVTDI